MFSYLAGLNFVYLYSDSRFENSKSFIKKTFTDLNLEQLEKIKMKSSSSNLSFSFLYHSSITTSGQENYSYTFRDSTNTIIFYVYFYYIKGEIVIQPLTINNSNSLFSRLFLTALGMSGVIQSDIVDNVVQNFPKTTINAIGTTKLKVKEDLFTLPSPGVTPEATITFTMPETVRSINE